MSPATEAKLKDRYHVAKLALFNVYLLENLQRQKSLTTDSAILTASRQVGFNELLPSLLNQTTFLQFGYTTLVWLYEVVNAAKHDSIRGKNLIESVFIEFGKIAENKGIFLPSSNHIRGVRQLAKWEDVVSFARNALSHGKVVISDASFEYEDQNIRGPNREASPTYLTVPWSYLPILGECMITALALVLWPTIKTSL